MRVLYVDFDCLRADHIGANGYHRNTSPNIDAIAKRGITFTQCHCANSPCVPSRASLFSGRFGINNGVVGHHGISEQFRPIWNSHWTDPERPTMHWQLWQSGMKNYLLQLICRQAQRFLVRQRLAGTAHVYSQARYGECG
jgi:arylsulfatase A-like enzyme